MKFEDLRREVLAHRKAVEHLERSAYREWVMSDMTLIRINVWPSDDATGGVTLSVSKWKPVPGATAVLADGREYKDGWWDHFDVVGRFTARELGYILAARLLVERWMSGQIDDLPTAFPDGP